MVSNTDRGEQDRYGRWFPPFPPAPSPTSSTPAPSAAETTPQDASPAADESTGMMFSPDNKAPAAASDPRASRDAPTPTWLSADQGPETTVSPRKPRKPKKPKPQKPPKAAPAPTPAPAAEPTPPPSPAPEPVRASVPAAAAPVGAPQAGGGRNKRPLIIGAAAAAVVVAVGALVVGLVLRPDTLSSNDADAAQPTAAASGFCAESESNGTIISNQPGDQSSGANAILAFEYAYYVERDAEKAREVVTPDAEVSTADRLQPFIDDIPTDTDYCAEIAETAPNQFLLNLHVKSPGVREETYDTGVKTTEIDGKTFITYMGKPL